MPTHGHREGRGYSALRRGRESLSNATYFLTICVRDKKQCLTDAKIRHSIFEILDELESDGSWTERCACLMPDHLHLLVQLGDRLTLSQCVARLKAKTKSALDPIGAQWQSNYFDHRVSPEEGLLPLFCYIYRNPYRANLIECAKPWLGWRCAPDDWKWFQDYLEDDLPPPHWMSDAM